MTPTDADRALALWAIDAHYEFAGMPLIDRVALAIAQARAEGAEVMREKAAREAFNAVVEATVDRNGDVTSTAHKAKRAATAIRALPTGEGS